MAVRVISQTTELVAEISGNKATDFDTVGCFIVAI
jgi:hypothetical protein